MTLSIETFKVSYNGDGAQTAFAVTFPFFQNAHVEAILRDADGTETTWEQGIDYALIGGEGATGTVTATTAPAVGEVLVIRRDVPFTQETDYPEGGPFPSASHEDALDFARMVDQQQQEQLDRALKLPASDPVAAVELAKVDVRKGRLLGFDSVNGTLAYFGSEINSSTDLVTATASTTPRTLADRFGEVFNVLDYGAKGDDATDDATAIQAAVMALSSNGRGVLYFPKGIYRISGAITLPSNCRVVGEGRATIIKTTSSSAVFGYGTDTNPTQTALTANQTAGSNQITLPTGEGANFSVGDYFILESDAIIMGTDGRAREAHQVRAITTDTLDIDGSLVWTYNTADSATFERQNGVGIDDVSVENMSFTSSDGGTTKVRTLQFNDCRNVRLENIYIFDAGGGIGIKECQDVQLTNIYIDHLPAFDDSFGYGIWVAGAATNVNITNFIARDMRHAFTTLADQRASNQYGGPRNVTLVNCHGTASNVTKSSATPLAIWDTHAYGRGITFIGCTADQASANACVQVRCEKVKFVGCSFRGGFRAVDIQVTADEVEIIGTTIIEGTTNNCLNINGQSGGRPALVNGCTIGGGTTRQIDVTGPGAIIEGCYIFNVDTEDLIRDSNSTLLVIRNNHLVQGSGGQVFQGLDSNAIIHGNTIEGVSDIRTNVQFGAADGSRWWGNWYGDTPQDGGVQAQPSSATLRRHEAGMLIVSTGSGGTVTYTLWSAQVGDKISFRRNDPTDLVRIDPDGTENIGSGGAGKYLQIDTDGTRIDLHCVIAGTWDILPQNGAVLATNFSFEP